MRSRRWEVDQLSEIIWVLARDSLGTLIIHAFKVIIYHGDSWPNDISSNLSIYDVIWRLATGLIYSQTFHNISKLQLKSLTSKTRTIELCSQTATWVIKLSPLLRKIPRRSLTRIPELIFWRIPPNSLASRLNTKKN